MARKKTIPAQIKIRLPEVLRRELEKAAANHHRTLNGEIVHRLSQPYVEANQQEIASAAVSRALQALLGIDVETAKRIASGELSYTIEPITLPENPTSTVLMRSLKVVKPPAPTNKEEKPK